LTSRIDPFDERPYKSGDTSRLATGHGVSQEQRDAARANEHDVAMATAEPGVWFWRGIDDRHGEWKRDASTPKRQS
jgi:hypothetical protein